MSDHCSAHFALSAVKYETAKFAESAKRESSRAYIFILILLKIRSPKTY